MDPDEPRQHASDPFDMEDRFSILNLVGGKFREAVLKIDEELMLLTEGELRERCNPTTTDYALRQSLWREYELAVTHQKTSIKLVEIYGSICSASYWNAKFLSNQVKVAWMLRPVQAYKKETEAMLMRASQRIWEILDMDLTGKDGKLDVRRGHLMLETYRELANRSKGMALQRIKEDKRSVSVHARLGGSPQQVKAVPEMTLAQLRQRMAELEGKTLDVKAIPSKGETCVVDADVVGDGEPVCSREGEREVITVGVVRSDDS